MPIVPAGNTTSPYQTIGDVMYMARVFVNDAFGPNGLQGDLLADANPATLILINSAWRSIQDSLADAGVEGLVRNVVLTGIPAAAVNDPSSETYLDWTQYYDGAVSHPEINLPYDLIVPTFLWERPSGSSQVFTPVISVDGGLPEGFQAVKFNWYEWRGDKCYFKGATQALDLKVRYLAYYPDLDGKTQTQLPLMRIGRAMAYLIASEYARPRGAAAADNLYAMAEAEIKKTTSRTARRKASIQYRRQSYGY